MKTSILKLTTLSFVFLILTIANSKAQTFKIKGGLNLANMLMKDEDGAFTEGKKTKLNLHAGIMAEQPITDLVSFETGLLLSEKGFKTDEDEDDYSSRLNLLYADIPLTLKYTRDIESYKVYGIFGPYVGIGLSGKTKTTEKYNGRTETNKTSIKWGSDQNNDDLKRLDYGLTVGTGLVIDNIDLGISYDLGLANISPYTGEGVKIKNRILKFSIGYCFGSRK